MLRRRIIGRTLQWPKRTLASHAMLQLLFHFLCAALFERVRAAAGTQPCDRKQDRHAFHLHML